MAPAYTYIQRGEPLLTIQDAGDGPGIEHVVLLEMSVFLLVIIRDELVKDEVLTVLRLHLPKEKRTDWIPLHQAIKEPGDLIGTPHNFSLDGREKKVITINPLKSLNNRDRCLKRHSRLQILPIRTCADRPLFRGVMSIIS
jgi:hypothetical protein